MESEMKEIPSGCWTRGWSLLELAGAIQKAQSSDFQDYQEVQCCVLSQVWGRIVQRCQRAIHGSAGEGGESTTCTVSTHLYTKKPEFCFVLFFCSLIHSKFSNFFSTIYFKVLVKCKKNLEKVLWSWIFQLLFQFIKFDKKKIKSACTKCSKPTWH